MEGDVLLIPLCLGSCDVMCFDVVLYVLIVCLMFLGALLGGGFGLCNVFVCRAVVSRLFGHVSLFFISLFSPAPLPSTLSHRSSNWARSCGYPGLEVGGQECKYARWNTYA